MAVIGLEADYQQVMDALDAVGDGGETPPWLDESRKAFQRIYEMAWMYEDLCE